MIMHDSMIMTQNKANVEIETRSKLYHNTCAFSRAAVSIFVINNHIKKRSELFRASLCTTSPPLSWQLYTPRNPWAPDICYTGKHAFLLKRVY